MAWKAWGRELFSYSSAFLLESSRGLRMCILLVEFCSKEEGFLQSSLENVHSG
jgi:hypothetical protein